MYIITGSKSNRYHNRFGLLFSLFSDIISSPSLPEPEFLNVLAAQKSIPPAYQALQYLTSRTPGYTYMLVEESIFVLLKRLQIRAQVPASPFCPFAPSKLSLLDDFSKCKFILL
jgi:hypothetical protein